MVAPEGWMLVPKMDAEKYAWVPKEWVEKYFSDHNWDNIKEPTISEAADYLKISVKKIKKDLNNYQCPLRKISNGGKGRGNTITFIKSSVEIYKEWLRH